MLTVLPGTLAPDVLAARLRTSDAAVVLKLGRDVRRRARRGRAGRRGRARRLRRAGEHRQAAGRAAARRARRPALHVAAARAGGESPAPTGSAAAAWSRSSGSARRDRTGSRRRRRPSSPPPTRSSATRPTSRACPSGAGSGGVGSDNRVEAERARAALELAAGGERVAVVSSGDPGIFAMAAAVLEALDEDGGGVEVRVVPGLSAMQAAAARVGAPLGHDFCVLSLSDQLKPWDVIERRLDAAGAADLALALYNPASRTRREQLERARSVLLRHRAPDTPVVVARAVGSGEEAVTVTTLGGLDAAVGRHAYAAHRRLVDDARDRQRRGAPARVHAAALSGVSAGPRGGLGDSWGRSATWAGRGGRSTTMTGRPRSRAASSLAARVVAAAVLGHDEVDGVAGRSGRARPPACRGRGRAARSQRRGSGGSGGSTQRMRNQASPSGERAQALAAGGEEHALAEVSDLVRGLRKGGDAVPAVAAAAATSPGARGAGAGSRWSRRPARPRPRSARRTGGWRRRRPRPRSRSSQRASASGPPKPPMRTAPSGSRGVGHAAGERGGHGDALGDERGRQRAGLGRAPEHEDH